MFLPTCIHKPHLLLDGRNAAVGKQGEQPLPPTTAGCHRPQHNTANGQCRRRAHGRLQKASWIVLGQLPHILFRDLVYPGRAVGCLENGRGAAMRHKLKPMTVPHSTLVGALVADPMQQGNGRNLASATRSQQVPGAKILGALHGLCLVQGAKELVPICRKTIIVHPR